MGAETRSAEVEDGGVIELVVGAAIPLVERVVCGRLFHE
jgi:hypothetical protein